MSNASIRALETYVHLMNNTAVPHVVLSAIRSGLIDHLRESQKTLDELAQIMEVDRERLRIFVEVLEVVGFVERYEEHLALSPVVHLIPNELGDFGHRYWQHLETWLSKGIAIPGNDASELDEGDFLRERYSSDWLLTPSAMHLADEVGMGSVKKNLSILDIGSGSAVLSMTLAYRDGETTVTALDNEEGLRRTRQTAESVGAIDRVSFIEISDNRFALPEGPFDLAIISNQAHLFEPEQLQELIRNVHSCLRPGGGLVVIDVFEGSTKGALSVKLFELQIALRYPNGSFKRHDSIVEMFENAGFQSCSYEAIESPPWIFGMVKGNCPVES